MSVLDEVRAMQNPALGSVLIWRFTCGYAPEGEQRSGAPFPVCFIVLPMLLHARTAHHVDSTYASSGIRKLVEKFKDETDLLPAIHDRMIRLRDLSVRSVGMGIASGLLLLDSESATLWPKSYAKPAKQSPDITAMLRNAEKLGQWIAPLSMFEVSGLLRVEF